ncbi:hypothetical protein I4U23_027110 [Adineta vaga]|nr:hypothetical protein I4U23_027110 [Adineta vaga]
MAEIDSPSEYVPTENILSLDENVPTENVPSQNENVSTENIILSDEKANEAMKTEEIIHQEPPRYGFLNPLALNQTNNFGPRALPQMQWNSTNNMRTIYGKPSGINGDVNQVESYLAWSVINILCCCLCLGFVACYFSSEVDAAKKRGDLQGALNASRSARNMNIITTVVGVIVLTIYGLYFGGILAKL